MPTRSARPCTTAGCPRLVRGGSKCEGCRRAFDHARGSSTERGYDAVWRRLRAGHLTQNPDCAECAADGRDVAARHVDHIRAHRGNDALRLDPANLRSLCHSCHSRKTVLEDGGLGRPRAC